MTTARRDFILWTVCLAAPLVWLCSFEANFALAPWARVFEGKLALYAVSLAAAILETANGIFAWSQWRSLGKEWPGDSAGPLPRARIMAICGIAFSAAFGMLVLAQAIPEIVLGACA